MDVGPEVLEFEQFLAKSRLEQTVVARTGRAQFLHRNRTQRASRTLQPGQLAIERCGPEISHPAIVLMQAQCNPFSWAPGEVAGDEFLGQSVKCGIGFCTSRSSGVGKTKCSENDKQQNRAHQGIVKHPSARRKSKEA